MDVHVDGGGDGGTSVVHRPLVVVSNRLPFTVQRREGRHSFVRAPGGLVTALEAVLAKRGGTWVGWPGIATDAAADAPCPPPEERVSYRAVGLSARDVQLYYGGFSNRTLWPLFHYFIGRMRIEAQTWRAYERVNERFADATLAAAPEDAMMWVHDYQLTLVPGLVRRRAPGATIGFFLHIPFPAADVFRILPWARMVLRGLLGADHIGFHTADYAQHFLTCAERLLGCDVDFTAGQVEIDGRTVSVAAHPLGIDVVEQERLAAAAPPSPGGTVREILGVDRLDYTKGIHERMRAIERLLETHPGYRRRIVFTQIAVPSREHVTDYRQLKREIDEHVGRINGRLSDRGWTPIRYMTRSLSAAELAALYRQADVGLVTPLLDGMNLVAKEYVASQVDGRGMLVLSEMAGAARELPEALIVNPYDVDGVAAALHRALTMSEEERRARLSALRDRVRMHDVHAWLEEFLAATDEAARRRASTIAPADRVVNRLSRWLARRQATELFLDYDGTLAPIVARPELATLSDEARRILELAGRSPELHVVVVSGRALADVRARVGIPDLTYVGEHGYEIDGPGISAHNGPPDAAARLDQAERELLALGVEGALVERKQVTIAFHVRGVARAERAAALERAALVLRRCRLLPLQGKEVLEGRPAPIWDKGHAVLWVLQHRHGADWPTRVRALYCGDDVTDEFAFRSLAGIGRSIRVGPATRGEDGTAADLFLPGPDDVMQLVRRLASAGTQ